MTTDFAARARRIDERIVGALARSGRAAGSVRLVAGSKTFPAAAVAEAARAGLTLFGENRVQEAVAKIPEVARLLGLEDPARDALDTSHDKSSVPRETPPVRANPSWHLVGHLQS